MSAKLSLALSLVALAFGSGCATAPGKVEAAQSPARATCPGGTVKDDARLGAYAGCQRVTGNLRISGVSSLRSLSALQKVDGKLVIENSGLPSLDGLQALRSVDALFIERNAELGDISALEGLREVDTLRFSGNPELTTLEGLEGVTELSQLVVEQTGFLTLEGLDGLRRVDHVEIRDNKKLISVAALNDVRSVREVVLQKNPVVCGKLGVLKGLMAPPSELLASRNRALQAREIEHLRPAIGAPEVAMR